MVNFAVALLARSPTPQSPVAVLYGVAPGQPPPVWTLDTNVKKFVSNRSFTTTPVAFSGPALATVTVKIIFSPNFGVGLLTTFERLK